MDYINIKTHLQVTARMFSALWDKKSTIRDWKDKHQELHRLARLLEWDYVSGPPLDKALKAYSSLYDILKTKENWFEPGFVSDTESKRWITYAVQESITRTDFSTLKESQNYVTERMMVDTLCAISRQYQTWKKPIPHDLQVYTLTEHPRVLPMLKDIISPDIARTYQPELWSLIQSLDAIYATEDAATKNKILEEWFRQEADPVDSKSVQVCYDALADLA